MCAAARAGVSSFRFTTTPHFTLPGPPSSLKQTPTRHPPLVDPRDKKQGLDVCMTQGHCFNLFISSNKYSVVLISAVEQSDSVYTHIHPFPSASLSSSQDRERVLHRRALFTHPMCKSLHLLSVNPHKPWPSVTTSLIPLCEPVSVLCVSLALFCREIHLCPVLDPTHKWCHVVFLHLTFFTWYDHL